MMEPFMLDKNARSFRLAGAVVLLFGSSIIVAAETLPLKRFTTSDGLAHDHVNRIVRDSRGFLWFCTGEGLSRFDGHQFVNFGPSQGFPGHVVWDFHETRSGDYWAATGGGLVRLPGAAGRGAQVYFPGDDSRPRTVLAVHEATDGT